MNGNRHYTLLDVFCLASGVMLSSGLFVLPGIIFAKAGPGIILAYALAALLIVPAAMALAELATAMPKSGGVYFFVERSIGPLAGTVTGLANWSAHLLKASFALIGIGALGNFFFPSLGQAGIRLIAIVFCIPIALLNCTDAKSAGRMQNILVIFVLVLLASTAAAGFGKIQIDHYKDFIPADRLALLSVVGLVFVSFGGLSKIADIAGEVVNPGKNIPLGLFLAYTVVNILAVSVIFVTVGTVDASILKNSLLAVSQSARVSMGPTGGFMLSIGALLAFIAAANSGILASSHSPVAMSRDGLLPERFSSKRFAVLSTAAVMILVLALVPIYELVKMASTMIIVLFILVNLAVLIMRKSGIQNYRPSFRMPLYPWIQVSAMAVYAILIISMGSKPLFFTESFALLAGIWYIGYVENRINRESAFVFMVKNIANKAIAPSRAGLEDELRHIALERDGVALDRFDHLIDGCEIIDVKNSITARELFKLLAETISRRFGKNSDELFEAFIEREKDSSTVVHPGLAVPHVIIDGENLFDIVLVRCRKGIKFDDIHKPVHAVFALVGSADQRNYHLKALMNIAHIVQEPDFEQRWFEAPDTGHIRDLILLSQRKRDVKHKD